MLLALERADRARIANLRRLCLLVVKASHKGSTGEYSAEPSTPSARPSTQVPASRSSSAGREGASARILATSRLSSSACGLDSIEAGVVIMFRPVSCYPSKNTWPTLD